MITDRQPTYLILDYAVSPISTSHTNTVIIVHAYVQCILANAIHTQCSSAWGGWGNHFNK